MRYELQCGASPIGTAPAQMSVEYVNANQCIWVDATSGIPTLTLAEGTQLALAIVPVWLLAIPLCIAINLMKDSQNVR